MTTQQLSPQEEMVLTLLDSETHQVVKNFLSSSKEAMLYERYDMSFRLLRNSINCVNLEILATTTTPASDKFFLGDLPARRGVMYFKPIGFFIFDMEDREVRISILMEFEGVLNQIIERKIISRIPYVTKLSLLENAMIASFSIEAMQHSFLRKDCSFWANGLRMDIFITFEGNPQIFADDKYGLESALGVYFFQGKQFSMNPALHLKGLYDNLRAKNLFTALKLV